MRSICVTGATGFVGREVVEELLQAGYHVNALVRASSVEKLPKSPHVNAIIGEVLNEADVTRAVAGCDAVLHLVGIRRSAIKSTGLSYDDVDLGSVLVTLKAMRTASVSRILLLSAASIGNSGYVQTKRRAEEAVRNSGLNWTIFRPAYITGPGQEWPKLMAPILKLIAMLPGSIGDLGRRAQNISRRQLSRSFIWGLSHKEAIGATLDVPQMRALGT